jgi:hypothetical protein
MAPNMDVRLAVRIVALVSMTLGAAACGPIGRVPVDATQVAPLIVFMHSLGVESYGVRGSCDHLRDARGAFISNLASDNCDPFMVDSEAATLFDDTARQEFGSLRERETSLALPRVKWIELGYDEQGLLTYAGFGVDICSSYTAQFEPPRDLSRADALESQPIPWSTYDVCATEDAG